MANEDGPDDFDAFYASTSRRVVGYLYVIVGDLPEAEDAAHEAYVRAWQRWSKLRHYSDPEAWVRTVGFRIAVSAWRKTRNRLAAHRDRRTEDVPELSPDRLAIVNAMRLIPAEQRRALVLFHMQGMSIEEISRETGAAPGTVKARISRGRKALAPLVSEFADDEGHDPKGPFAATEKGAGADV